MKKLLIYLVTMLVLVNLSGCGSTDTSFTSRSDQVLLKAIDLLSKANSYEYTRVESTYAGQQNISQIISEHKTILEPYVNWSRASNVFSRIDGNQYKTSIEVYHILNNDQFNMYLRSSSEEDAITSNEQGSGDWENIFSGTDEQADLIIDSARSNLDAQLYLLSSNIDTFKEAQDSEVKDESIIKYNGHLEQSTIIEAYRIYIREIYVKGNMLPNSENMSPDELRNEITSGDHLELQVGIPRLAFSDKPIPLSIWVDKNSFKLVRVTVDETSTMKSLMENVQDYSPGVELPIISEALVTYDIRGIDELKEIPMPE